MASRELYSPKYDSQGNPKPSIPELTDAVENARLEAEDFARQSEGNRDDTLAARDEALGAVNDLGALGGIDGTAEQKTGSSTLEKADGTTVDASTHSGEIWYVVDETKYYESTGTNWRATGPDLSDASRLTKGTLPAVQHSREVESAVQAGHAVSVFENGSPDVFTTSGQGSKAAAVQAAHDRANNNGGGRVVHPFRAFSAPSVNHSKVRLEWPGRAGVILPMAYGAEFIDGTRDDESEMNVAAQAAITRKEKFEMPSGTVRVTSPLTFENGGEIGLRVQGQGSGRRGEEATTIELHLSSRDYGLSFAGTGKIHLSDFAVQPIANVSASILVARTDSNIDGDKPHLERVLCDAMHYVPDYGIYNVSADLGYYENCSFYAKNPVFLGATDRANLGSPPGGSVFASTTANTLQTFERTDRRTAGNTDNAKAIRVGFMAGTLVLRDGYTALRGDGTTVQSCVYFEGESSRSALIWDGERFEANNGADVNVVVADDTNVADFHIVGRTGKPQGGTATILEGKNTGSFFSGLLNLLVTDNAVIANGTEVSNTIIFNEKGFDINLPSGSKANTIIGDTGNGTIPSQNNLIKEDNRTPQLQQQCPSITMAKLHSLMEMGTP